VPPRAIDEFLPLRVEPAAAERVRVFVGRIELVTPATTYAVEHALAMSDWSTLQQYGRFIEPILQRIAPASLESGKRAAAVLHQCR
jgi:hypothetical protein